MGVGAVNTVSGFRWRCVVLSAPRVLQGRSPPTFCPSLRCKRRYTSIALSQNPWPTAAKSTSNLGKDHTDPSPEGRKVSTALRSIEQVLKTDLGGTDLWMRRVQAAQRDLQSRRRGRLAVLGDDIAGYRDVVTALVYDPLADSEEIRQGLLSRPFRTEDDVIIVRWFSTVTPLACLAGFLAPENRNRYPGNQFHRQADAITDQILYSDAAMLILDPYRLLSPPYLTSLLPDLSPDSNLHLVVNGSLPSSSSEGAVREELIRQLHANAPHLDLNHQVTIHFVHAGKALLALDSLAHGISVIEAESPSIRALAFQQYQHDFLASQMGDLQASLSAAFSAPIMPSRQIVTASKLAKLAIAYIENVIAADTKTVRLLSSYVRRLRDQARKAAEHICHGSVVNRGVDNAVVEGGVGRAMSTLRESIEDKFKEDLNWLRLVARARVDEIAGDFAVYLRSHFASDLERELVFEAGQLVQLQRTMSAQVDATLRHLASRDHSNRSSSSPLLTFPTLLNRLSTLSMSVPPVEPQVLLEPISMRRRQILTDTVPRLQRAAHRILFTSGTLGILGAAGAWMAYITPVSTLSASTAVALGALSAVSSAALGQRMWSRAQVQFWKDWNRITMMMREDLQSTLSRVIDEQLLSKPLAAAQGLQDVIQKREARLQHVSAKVAALKDIVV